MTSKTPDDASAWIVKVIKDFARSSENTLCNAENEPAWNEPLVGFSSGGDPLYLEIKGLIGDFYWTPAEIFRMTFPSIEAAPEDLTVISWVLPQTTATRRDQTREKKFPSERWARSRSFGEEFNTKLRAHVAACLKERGHEALAPSDSPLWGRRDSRSFGISSNWSERHAAYISGLGTFGLCDGLITAAGKAVRLGSVIALIQVAPTSRPYKDLHEYCLFYSAGTCGKCIERCPAKAISKNGHDKSRCAPYTGKTARRYSIEHFHIDTPACGLCQTGVPCESGIPGK